MAQDQELPGMLVVLSGPSGVGKTTVAARLVEKGGYVRSISVTTRAPRGEEVDGRDYRFQTVEQFESLCARAELIEHAEVHGKFYGTPKQPLRDALARNQVMLLVIDVDGAFQVKHSRLDALLVFLLPPDRHELARRLGERGTEDVSQRTVRLNRAQIEEQRAREFYDHLVVNDDLERCVEKVHELVLQARRGLAQRLQAGEKLYPGL
ncbi:MAG: guanylate kinase [Planctomycetes bacterium]|nr:guanylate kinase [Planctomycetota bacterium]